MINGREQLQQGVRMVHDAVKAVDGVPTLQAAELLIRAAEAFAALEQAEATSRLADTAERPRRRGWFG